MGSALHFTQDRPTMIRHLSSYWTGVTVVELSNSNAFLNLLIYTLVTGEQPVDYGCFSSGRKAKGKAASVTLQKCYSILTNQITPEDIAPELFAKEIINGNDVEKAKNFLYLKQVRAQNLLLTLMRKVEARPEWFDTICNILEKESVTVVENLRSTHVKLWLCMQSILPQ